jgi:hypothetical protein
MQKEYVSILLLALVRVGAAGAEFLPIQAVLIVLTTKTTIY